MRGLRETMISDNAKTFKAMSKEVRKVLLCPKLSRFLASKGLRLKFIAERSPWEGGVGTFSLQCHVEFCTILVEIEGVINSRPLT